MTNRRAFLGKMGATALIGAGALTACNNAQNQTTAPTAKGNPDSQTPPNPFAKMTYNFYGTHQAGITTPVQHHAYFLVAELHSTNIDEIRQMFKDWTEYSAKLTQGKNIKPYDKNPHLPPVAYRHRRGGQFGGVWADFDVWDKSVIFGEIGFVRQGTARI